MTLISEIHSLYYKEGLRTARRNAKSWYTSAKDSDDDLTVVKLPEGKGYLEPGKIHIFTYNPIGKNILDYYDKKPIVISLGTIKEASGNIYDLGINLNFIPEPYKWYVLNTVREIYKDFYFGQMTGRNASNALTQNRIKYKYTILKQMLHTYGVEFAIRKYIPSRKSRVYVTSYETWLNIAFLSIENFEGITLDEMIKKYKASKI